MFLVIKQRNSLREKQRIGVRLQKAIDSKLLTFWALLEKVGGDDANNAPNYLFINTFPDIDKAGDVWSNVEATTGMKMADIETNSLSTTTSQFFYMIKTGCRLKMRLPKKNLIML